MMSRMLTAWLCLIVLVAGASIGKAQKAYDLVTYAGTVGTKQIVFAFGDGYPEASTVTVKDPATKRATEYLPDGSGEMRFVAKKKDAGTIVLKMDPYAAAPSTVSGTLTVGGTSEAFKLRKK